MTERILAERVGKVAVLTVDAPDRRNSLTLALSADLARAVEDAERDENVHAVVVTGTPPAFCAGADLTALGEAKEEGLRAVYAGFLAVARCSLPTIAAVGGAAVGAGLNLALAADVRIAGPRAKFIPRFLELGLHPGGGFTWMLQRAVGVQRARAMTLFGQSLDAAEAESAGLSSWTVDGTHEELLAAALELAAPAAAAPREVVVATKRSMRLTSTVAEHADAVEIELGPQIASLGSPEFARRLAVVRESIKSGK
ncbi:enoyl-CoA hydratase [Amycolatopsis bartoniae]|uniref:Enoyl-CoA hydratase n=1 Tax=Amycolatopsis bartoniae TaxID=941986 RepID=A0A8H9IZ57_9PSEU|nr:enoyl-CoA hydratase [Amycolatopsis bartoniae]MBB2933710.1 enoyl-CoA hydratase [Amycolatopsis bartoniae]TVT10617.1 enoyl-CoA hydratase [Amycolatopsis bartoniae]GHF72151.1 enoyl-CoA hydratase [Amycolatopsis bartoniae]